MDKYQMELNTYESEKRMNHLALKGLQWNIANELNGAMGKDMKNVLEGKKKVKLSLYTRIKFKFNNFLRQFL